MSLRSNVFRLTRNYALVACLGLLGFALFADDLQSKMLLAGFMGFAIAGTMVGLHAMAPLIYPTRSRNTGLGWAIGFGRSGAVLGPYLAGLLLTKGLDRSDIYMVYSLPMLLAMLAGWCLLRHQASQEQDSQGLN